MYKQISIFLISIVFLMGCSGTVPKLGVNNGQLVPCPKTPNCVSSQASAQTHFIAPIYVHGTPLDAQVRLLQVLNALPRTKIVVAQDDYIRAEFTSKIFRFIDDVEFYFPSTKSEKTAIHVRSASRIGYSDLGANHARIEQIRAEF